MMAPISDLDFYKQMYRISDARVDQLENALKAIKHATLNGDVCDDVAWFNQIETLHDFCDRILGAVGRMITDDK